MPSVPNRNPLFQLLRQLPKPIGWQKRRAIKADLVALGKWEHYRQRVLRSEWKLGNTHIACAAVLVRQLGISYSFFTDSAQQQQQEVEQILSSYQH
ncbi:hypothetical protein G8759_19850 [Spirosoma aureum]|uniref:Uncharacterized protein n=1 Tax=Spirosoma aureum TaxID=2692134 RepID=A0A6G9AR00_9BACT|nr:hypothetical protein [Spirosoma aureum]QIP14705.1 hypothetical protein G8759_19850 [Spirosoma aureum]